MYTVYTGEHVRLRPFRDAEELLSCAADNQYASFVHWGPFQLTASELRKEFTEDGAMPLPGSGRFAIELIDGELAGTSYYAVNRGGMLAGVGTFIRRHLRRRRLGVEARQLCMCFVFENLGVGKIEAVTLSNNIAALTSLERCGMLFEGCQRGVHFSQGRWESHMYYAMFREVWERMDYRHKVKRGV